MTANWPHTPMSSTSAHTHTQTYIEYIWLLELSTVFIRKELEDRTSFQLPPAVVLGESTQH